MHSNRDSITCFLEIHATYLLNVGARAFGVLIAFIAAEENKVAIDIGHALGLAFFQIFAVHNNLATAACAVGVTYAFFDCKRSDCSRCQFHMHTHGQDRGLVVDHAGYHNY